VFDQMKNANRVVPSDVTYSDFMAEVDQGKVVKAELDIGNLTLTGHRADGSGIKTKYAGDDGLAELLRSKKVDVDVKQSGGGWQSILISLLPTLLFIGILVWFMRSMGKAQGGAMTFGKSKAKMVTESKNPVTFKDVLGADEAIEEVREFVDILKNPKRYAEMGVRIPKGILLMGPPGTGKTLLARAVAGEAKRPFFSISGSDFVEMFVGVGASRVRDLFEQASKNAPCVLFIDEIDGVGRHRGAGLGGGHDEREQTLNQLLKEMDGFEANTGVLIMAATNRPDVLDPALVRPGRFDRQVVVGRPDMKGRLAILTYYARKVKLAPDADLLPIAAATYGWTGADLENLLNEAALMAGRKNISLVTAEHIWQARDKIGMGPERRTLTMSDDERRKNAVHEAGHSLVRLLTPGKLKFHKATIIPRGRALGVSWSLPDQDVLGMTSKEIEADIMTALGGLAAEELIFETHSTGVSNDLTQASQQVRDMVVKYGMSKLGIVSYEENDGPTFLGRDFNKDKAYSEDTGRRIDEEVRSIMERLKGATVKLLTEHRAKLDLFAAELLKRETMDSAEVKALLQIA
jgi:cell division protease FtsH